MIEGPMFSLLIERFTAIDVPHVLSRPLLDQSGQESTEKGEEQTGEPQRVRGNGCGRNFERRGGDRMDRDVLGRVCRDGDELTEKRCSFITRINR